MKLTRQDVEKVSLLARLKLSDKELDTITNQLGEIVQYVDLLSDLDTEDVPPMVHGVEQFNVFTEDEPRPSLKQSEALANSPKHDEECYRVPAVLGD